MQWQRLQWHSKMVRSRFEKLLPFLPYIATSSVEITQELKTTTFPPGTQLFTMDVRAMYTNIHLGHALPSLEEFLCHSPLGKEIVCKVGLCLAMILHALELVMNNNVFAFGDTFWLQTAGTAMGIPPAPTWATIYYCLCEILVIPEFDELRFYRRYIDDRFAAWLADPTRDNNAQLKAFKARMQSFGLEHCFFTENLSLQPLQWTFSELSSSAIFLDLNISINALGKISTTIYEKELYLYLYITALSCHSRGVLRELIFGTVHRVKHLCTNHADRVPFLTKCYHRLLNRGYQASAIKPIFLCAIRKLFSLHASNPPTLSNSGYRDTTQLPNRKGRPLFLHVSVNPVDPPSSSIQDLFQQTICTDLNPDDDLSQVCNQLTVCYHGQQSLKNILSPQKGRFGTGYLVSETPQQFKDT